MGNIVTDDNRDGIRRCAEVYGAVDTVSTPLRLRATIAPLSRIT